MHNLKFHFVTFQWLLRIRTPVCMQIPFNINLLDDNDDDDDGGDDDGEDDVLGRSMLYDVNACIKYLMSSLFSCWFIKP